MPLTFLGVLRVTASIIAEEVSDHGVGVTYQQLYPQHKGTGSNGCWYGALSYDAGDRGVTGPPACLVGRVLYHLGFWENVREGASARAILLSTDVNRWETFHERNLSAHFLESLQRNQDAGQPWAEAFIQAMQAQVPA